MENVHSQSMKLHQFAFLEHSRESFLDYLMSINDIETFEEIIDKYFNLNKECPEFEEKWVQLISKLDMIEFAKEFTIVSKLNSWIKPEIRNRIYLITLVIHELNNKQKFISWSESPEKIEIEGNTLFEKLNSLKKADYSDYLDYSKLKAPVLILTDAKWNQTKINKNKMLVDNEADVSQAEIIYWDLSGNEIIVPTVSESKILTRFTGYSPYILKHFISNGTLNNDSLLIELLNGKPYDYLKLF